MAQPIVYEKPHWGEYLPMIDEMKDHGLHAHSGTLETFQSWDMLKEYFKTLEREEGPIISMEYEVATGQRAPERSRKRGQTR